MGKPISLAGRDGLREATELTGSNCSDDTTLARWQAMAMARRFGLRMPVAAIVAALALGPANG